MMYLRAPTIKNERHRLEVLAELRLLDSTPDPEFDNLVELTASFFSAKYALVSLVDAERQWFKANHGLDASETPREPSFCGHAIASDNIFLVLDAKKDERFSENPLVINAPHVRFYAGAPILFKNAAVGTLCIIDELPRAEFDEDQQRHLDMFAKIAEELIEARQNRLSR